MKYLAASAACGSENGKALPAAIGLPARSGVLRAGRPGSDTTLAGALTEAWKSSSSCPWRSASSERRTFFSGTSRSSSAASCLMVERSLKV